jgi:hypothetical protein
MGALSRFFAWWTVRRTVAVFLPLLLAYVAVLGACALTSKLFPEANASTYVVESSQGLLREGKLCIEGMCRPAVLVSGALPKGARKRIDERIANAGGAALSVCFASPGGDAEEALGGPFPANVSTCVPRVVYANGAISEGKCLSTCAWLWMSGQHREAFRYAVLGFHESWSVDACWCWTLNKVLAADFRAKLDHVSVQAYAGNPSEVTRRRRLMTLARGMGPNEFYEVTPALAIELGLQEGPVRKATFFVLGAPETLL